MKTKWIYFYIRTIISFFIYYLLNSYIKYSFCLNIYVITILSIFIILTSILFIFKKFNVYLCGIITTTGFLVFIFVGIIYIFLLAKMNTEYSGEFFMQMEYDKFGRLIKGWIPHETKRNNFNTKTYEPDVIIEYDAHGNVLKRTDNASDIENALITSYEYSLAGVLQKESIGALVTKYNYDNAGRLIKTTNQNGIVSNRVYDGSGRLVKEYFEGENTSLSYDYYSNGTIKSKKDRNGNETSYEYDSMNRVIKENTADLIQKTYEWNGLGQKTSENDKENNLRSYEYDGLGRLIKETINTEPETILYYDYDARGNVTMFKDATGIIFKRKYTDTDLLSEEKVYIKENGVDVLKTSRSYFYDEAGILKSVTEDSNKVYYNNADSKYQPDAYGNIRSMKWEIGTDSIEMKYDYDLLGRTTGVTTPDGKTITYSYDKNGLLTVMNGFINGNINYETDKSRIEYYTLENGMKKSFSYNSLGNISSMEYSAEDKKTGFSYIYDNNFNISSRTSLDTNKTSWFTYDAANRLTQSQMCGAFETRENLSGRKLSQIDLDLAGTKNVESYFEVLPQNITLDTSARSFVYNFERAVNVNKIELFPDVSTHRVRERDIRIYCKESEGSDWDEITNWKFTKDVRNGSLSFKFKEAFKFKQIKIHCIWDDRNFQNVSLDLNAIFKGNPLNLLRIWTLDENRTEGYEYDGNSSRIKLTENRSEREYEYYKNKENGNTARVMYDGKWWYTYDANGNRTARAAKAVQDGNSITIDKTNEYWEYTWDLWNRLIKVEQHNAPDNAQNVLVEYTYDVLNHRIERISKTKASEEKTQYAYGRNGVITYQKKTVGNTVTTRSYTYLNNQVVGFTDKEDNKENEYYTVTDIQGSVTEVYDKNKKLVWKSGYTAFGIKAGETIDLIDFDGLYTGCDYDVETGLSYHWNRWQSEDGYNWLSEDPARDGCNWYGYAGQNPIKYTDTNGLAVIKKGIGGKYIVRSQDYFEIAIFDKIQAASYSVFGNKLTELSYKASGEYKIKENTKSNYITDSLLSAVSLAGDLNINKTLERAGTVASIIGWIGVGKDLIETHKNNLIDIAIEDFTCSIFFEELSSSSIKDTEKLYLFTKDKVDKLVSSSRLSLDYDSLGLINSYKCEDDRDIEVIKNDINNYKRELTYGGEND